MDELKIKLCKDIAGFLKKDIDLVIQNTDKSLFCDPFYLTTEEILYLYFYIKKTYRASMIEEEIIEGSFKTIDRIYSLIQ